MSRFELEKPIPSCDVSKELIGQLEDYVIEQTAQITGTGREKAERSCSIAITDNFGEEQISSIRKYAPSAFPDSTSQIRLGCRTYASDTGTPLMIAIRFNKEKAYCKMSIEHSSDEGDARATVLGLYEGFRRLIAPHKNFNRFFHPHPILQGALGGTIGICGVLVILSVATQESSMVLPGIALFCSALFYPFSGILNPYISFDSRSSHRNRRLTSWVLVGLATFIVFGTISVFIRKKLLGW